MRVRLSSPAPTNTEVANLGLATSGPGQHGCASLTGFGTGVGSGAMGDRRAAIEAHKAAITAAARRHRATSIAIFGSVARGDDDERSDIDFLVDFEPGSSLFDLLHLQDELTQLLGCAVDLVSSRALKDRDEHIRREAIPL